MQRYVYHMVPSEMVGQELMPLNRLGHYFHIYMNDIRKNILIILRDRNYS